MINLLLTSQHEMEAGRNGTTYVALSVINNVLVFSKRGHWKCDPAKALTTGSLPTIFCVTEMVEEQWRNIADS